MSGLFMSSVTYRLVGMITRGTSPACPFLSPSVIDAFQEFLHAIGAGAFEEIGSLVDVEEHLDECGISMKAGHFGERVSDHVIGLA